MEITCVVLVNHEPAPHARPDRAELRPPFALALFDGALDARPPFAEAAFDGPPDRDEVLRVEAPDFEPPGFAPPADLEDFDVFGAPVDRAVPLERDDVLADLEPPDPFDARPPFAPAAPVVLDDRDFPVDAFLPLDFELPDADLLDDPDLFADLRADEPDPLLLLETEVLPFEAVLFDELDLDEEVLLDDVPFDEEPPFAAAVFFAPELPALREREPDAEREPPADPPRFAPPFCSPMSPAISAAVAAAPITAPFAAPVASSVTTCAASSSTFDIVLDDLREPDVLRFVFAAILLASFFYQGAIYAFCSESTYFK